MNTYKTINTEYLRVSKTIETILVSKKHLNKIFFIYNCEGNSFRLFKSHLNLIHFFQNKKESDFHFKSDSELDSFLSKVDFLID